MKKSISLLLVLVLCCIPLFGFSTTGTASLSSEGSVMSDNESTPQEGYAEYEPIPPQGTYGEYMERIYGPGIWERLYNQSRSHILSDILAANGLHSSILSNYPWPPAFGGTYLDDTGIYVVCVVDDDPEFKAYITSLFEGTGVPYYFQSVTYSYNYLTELVEEINNKYFIQRIVKEEPLVGIVNGSLGAGITLNSDKTEMVVRIYMKDVSEEAIALFKENISDSPAIVFIFRLSGVIRVAATDG